MQDFHFGNEYGSYGESEDSTIGRFVWLCIRLFALTFSALTTAAFFYLYVGNAFDFFFGEWSPFVVAVAGVIALDGLSQAWAYVRGNDATTIPQMTAARIMSWADLTGSVVVTVIYLMLNSAFDVGITTAAGELTALGYWLHVTGVVILVLSIAANFIAAHVYVDMAQENMEAVQRSKMAAMERAGRFHVDEVRQKQTISNTVDDIMRELPQHASREGARRSGDYLRENFRDSPAPPQQSHDPRDVATIPVWDENESGYQLMRVMDGEISISNAQLTLEQAWQRVDSYPAETDVFVVRAGDMQPVNREGEPIYVEMIMDNVDEDELAPGGNGPSSAEFGTM